MAKQMQVLLLVYPGFDVLDLMGPGEVFISSTLGGRFKNTLASATELTTTDNVIFKRSVSFTELLEADADGRLGLDKFDIIVVPGATLSDSRAVIEEDGQFLAVIRAFVEQRGMEQKQRWLLSVCTGALIVGATGVFTGRTVTTHYSCLEELREQCATAQKRYGGAATQTVRKRFVDAGTTDSGVRVITAGGVSCGIDAGLWIVSVLVGLNEARATARLLDHAWRYGEVDDATEGWLLESKNVSS